MRFGGRANRSKKLVDDGNLTAFIRYRLLMKFSYSKCLHNGYTRPIDIVPPS
jgi:hypothetical protein